MPIQFFHAFSRGVKAWHAAHRNILPLPELSEWILPKTEHRLYLKIYILKFDAVQIRHTNWKVPTRHFMDMVKATFTRDRICSHLRGIGSTKVRNHSVYTGPVQNLNGTVPYRIAFIIGIIWYHIADPIHRSGVHTRLINTNFVPVRNRSGPVALFNTGPGGAVQNGSSVWCQLGPIMKVILYGTIPFQFQKGPKTEWIPNGSEHIQYAIPKIKMLCSLCCLKARWRLLCNKLLMVQQPEPPFKVT